MHLIRPDRVYGTGVLSAIPGFSPVQNAQDVAARFTAIWAPRVTDAPAAGASAGVQATASSPVPTPAAPTGLSGFGAPGPMGRLRGWWYRRKLKKALSGYHGRQLAGFGDVRPPSPQAGAIPIVGGYAPSFQNQADVGLAITSQAMSVMPQSPFMPAGAAAAGISPYALAAQQLAQRIVGPGLPPVVATRANAAALSRMPLDYRGWGRR